MQSLFVKIHHLLLLLMLIVLSAGAIGADTDGDGVDDIQDAYPDDASKQYLPIAEAISKVEDQNLRSCLEIDLHFRRQHLASR